MALIKCSECKAKISDTATICLTCGAPVAKKKKGTTKAEWIFAAIIGLGFVWWLAPWSDSSESASEVAAAQACAKGDLSCWAKKHSFAAGVYCKRPIERLAKYDFKWTDSAFEPRIARYKWGDLDNNVVTYIGDRVQFQNGFGAFSTMIYECDLSPDGKTVLGVRVHEGRLPK